MKDGIHSIDGSDYCFDKDGYLLKGWISLGGNRYYADGSGVLQKSKWISYRGAMYYMKEDGRMAVSEKTPDGRYVNSEGQRSDFVDAETGNKIKELQEKANALPKLNKRVHDLEDDLTALKKFKKSMVVPGATGILKGKVKNKNVRLKWNKSRMANGYLVYRTDAGGKFRQIATLKGSKGVTFTDKKVTAKKTYRYRAYKSAI